MNQTALSGYLTMDPELRRTSSGKAVCRFSLAVRRTKDVSDFIPITCWEGTAEFVSRYFRKGSRVEVCGRLQQESWEDNTGTRHSRVYVRASSVDFGERAPKASPAAPEAQAAESRVNAKPEAQKPYMAYMEEPPELDYRDLSEEDEELPY